MCGIFGILSKDCSKNIEYLALLNSTRGNRGFGGLSVSEDEEIIFRYSKLYSKVLWIPQNKFLLCHLLAPTGEYARVHPFETDKFVLAHNGILLNYKKFTEYMIGPVDSQYLLGMISRYEGITLEAIIWANSLIEGQRACWMWDRFAQRVYFWRVMSPLYFQVENDNIVFSSKKILSSFMAEEGLVYSVGFDLILKEEEKFNFSTPYQY